LGKCRIISHDGDGLYTVQMLPDFSIIEAEIAKLTAQLSDIDNVELVNLEIAYLLAKADTDNKKAAADTLIDTYASDPTPEKLDAVNESIAVVGEAIIKESEAKIPYDAVKARKLAMEKRIVKLYAAIGTPSPVQIWCTDLSDGLKFRSLYDADDVAGTIELIGDDTDTTLQPHYADLGLYSSIRDGLMTPTASLTPASYFYNRAMKPAWQKWQHQFRPGIITGVTGGGGFDVTLDDVRSREQSDFIPVSNFEDGLLTGVTAEYMNCNESAFSVGDHVIVNTQWAGALRTDIIIGFVDNPKPCEINGFIYHPFVSGGTQPGYNDWQNVGRGSVGSWQMKTPVLTDVITDGTGTIMRDWKSYLNSGEKVLVQWVYNGDFIYLDGVKIATTPSFNMAGFTGDPITIAVMTGFNVAWVTANKQYLYAIPRENGRSRRLLRKTINPELTGSAYNATTDPDGWEDSAPWGPPDYTDFTSFSIASVNESGTEGRSMDSWVHGAKRSPQTDPGAGAVWLSASGYNDNWPEESQFSISNPTASTIAGVGLSYSFNGLIGAGVFREYSGSQVITYLNGGDTSGGAFSSFYQNGNRADSYTETNSGTYAISVGYVGDSVTYLRINGTGSTVEVFDQAYIYDIGTGVFSGESARTITSVNYGVVYESDSGGWLLPLRIEDKTSSDTWTNPGTGGADQCERIDGLITNEQTNYGGSFDSISVSDGIYVYFTDEDYLSTVTNYGGSPCVSGNVPGSKDTITTITERGSVLLGTTQQDFQRVPTNTSITESVLVTPPFIEFPAPRDFFFGDPDPYVWFSNTSSAKYNLTGLNWGTVSGEQFVFYGGAKDHNDNYIFSTQHLYNLALTSEYWSYLTNGDLATLDELDNGDGTVYRFPHVAN